MYDPSVRFGGFSSDQYVRQSRADPEQVVPLVIGLLPGDFNALEREFYSVSNPTQVTYGQYLAQEQADHLSRPADGALDAVHNWIGEFGSAGTFSPTSNLYKVQMKVKHVERLLRTEIHHYEMKETEGIPAWKRRRLMRAASTVAVPEHLESVVSFLSVNTHPLGLRALGAASSQVAEMNGNGGTLAQVRQTYGIPDDLVVTNDGNTQCVPSFYDESYDPADLVKFIREYLPGETPPQII
ncbi:Tripeptidyl-peptidase, partial [Phytophthora palmivora]